VGRFLKPGDVIVYESTVYPGATEEVCVPALEAASGLQFNSDFFVGYSPERINPGDSEHRLETITKVVSGSTKETLEIVDKVYSRVVSAGTHRASSIRVAEAAKVIENIQRDVNIALINELAMLFKILGLDTGEVLDAAATKWNFHPYRPGLVGGHCIGVDPYYLTHKAQTVGFHTEMILSGRRINDNMSRVIADQIIAEMLARKFDVARSSILIMGMTFKANCPDIRNTKVVDLISYLKDTSADVIVYDPHADVEEVMKEYGINLVEKLPNRKFEAVILAVDHNEFREFACDDLKSMLVPEGILYDLKGVRPRGEADLRL
jgi:UDP-N-acetyl-D-galactosamine dehydrogenase